MMKQVTGETLVYVALLFKRVKAQYCTHWL